MHDLVTSGLEALIATSVIGYVLKKCLAKTNSSHGVPYPPGPTPLPILGNALAVDVSAPWVTYKKWGSQYGDLVYFRLFGQDNIVINSEQIARDLLETRSQNYSNRPEIVTNELLGTDYNTVFMQYNSRWRLQRKILQRSFRQDAVPMFRPMQAAKTHELLLNLLEDPLDCLSDLEMYSSSIIMSAVYSYQAVRRNDDMVELVKDALNVILKELRPEIAAVFTSFPFLLHLPSWFPGMRLKRVAPFARSIAVNMVEKPFAYTEGGLTTGSISSCMVADHLLEMDEGTDDAAWQRKALKEAASTAYGAGTDTTSGVLMNFVLAMVLHPDIQDKAHGLIQRVVGTKRLPTFEDRPSLIYIDAIYRECLRWHPMFPLGIMHAAIESDGYDGYYIPKGATITPNIWAMTRNEAKYPNPDTFNPDRFLNADGTLTDDTVSFAWGFGRRICPGRHLAEASLFSAMTCLLVVFKFSKPKDETGREIKIEPRWEGGVTVRPVHFSCNVTPRNADMDAQALQDLIRASV